MASRVKTLPSIYAVTCHTDHVGPGSIFVAIKGTQFNGIDFIPEALNKGASTIVINKDEVLSHTLKALCKKHNASILHVENTRKALAQLSAKAYNYPSNKLTIIGITGTKGKSTSAYLLFELLQKAGHKTALLSTIENKINDQAFSTSLTTQHPDYLHMFFNVCNQHNITYVVMEVAAQALSLYRLECIVFDAILFTNFSQEHGEFYDSIEEYFKAKCQIVNHIKKNASVIINNDDQWLKKLSIENCLTFGQSKNANYRIEVASTNSIQCSFGINGDAFTIQSPLIGLFNVYNIAGVISVALQLGIDQLNIQQTLKTFSSIPGRLEEIKLANGARCFIDYAHNPSSFESVLSTLRSMTDHLIVIFGCGGDRDKEKRPIMGTIAAEYADQIYLTSDNPRSEDPAIITQQIVNGISKTMQYKVKIELDRKKAIEEAIGHSSIGSIIALLGKGPDHYQLIKAEKIYFNEHEIVMSFFTNKQYLVP